MLKKSLLSLAVSASVLGLAGCNISSTTDNSGATPDLQVQQQAAMEAYGTYPLFDALNSVLPTGIDLLFAAAGDTDGTASVGFTGGNPVFEAINDMDGISTLAPIDFKISGSVDPATVVKDSTVFLVKVPSKSDVQSGFVFPDVVGEDGTGYNIADEGEDFKALSPENYEALDLTHFGALLAAANFAGDATAINSKLGANLTLLQNLQDSAVNGEYDVSVISLDGGTDNVIRISPTKPLEPKSKYIVAITNGVTDAGGEALKPSPDYALAKVATDAAGNLTAEASKISNSALVAVSLAVNGWEGVAANATGAAPLQVGFNPADVIISSAFTTTDPSAVLSAMAYPGAWAPSVITNDTIAQAVINAGAAVAGVDAVTYEGIVPGTTKIEDAIIIANGALTGPGFLPEGATAYEHPRARTVETILAAPGTALRLTPAQLTASFDTPLTEDVLIGQSAIELPQYTVKFDGTDASSFSDIWTANAAVGAVLDGALGQTAGTTPPSDTDGSKNVTYRFPFATEKRKAVVPLLTFEPQAGSTGNCTKGAGWPVVIMQHGFTSDRTGNLINGSKIADLTCHAVIAMDLPHHGVAPTGAGFGLNVDYAHTTEAATQTPFAAAVAASVAAATEAGQAALDATILDDLAERHEGFYGVGGVPTPVVYADDAANRVGDSGTLWIRLDNFQRTRDNIRQAVMDLLNLNASLGSLDLDGDGTPDLDTSSVSYIGHSLGAIVGTPFLAVNNQSAGAAMNPNLNLISKAVLATPGGHLTKLIENSVGIGPDVIDGLDGNGVSQGSSTFESFMKVFQATVDSADPMNFASALSASGIDIPTLVVGMYGDLANGAPGDLVVPVNADGIQLAADTFVLADGATSQPDSARNPLTGLDPMLELMGAENIKDTPAGSKIIAKYNEGGHGTFSSAGTRSSSAPDFDSAAAYGEMLNQTVALLLNGTPAISNGDVLKSDAP